MNTDFSDSTMRNEFELWLGKNKPQVSVHTGIDIAQYWIEKVKLLKSALKAEIESKRPSRKEVEKFNVGSIINNCTEVLEGAYASGGDAYIKDILSSDLLK